MAEPKRRGYLVAMRASSWTGWTMALPFEQPQAVGDTLLWF
jgi:hypothetical protein